MPESVDSKIDGDDLVVSGGACAGRYDTRQLIAALFVHIARGDGVITAAESGQMLDFVRDYFSFGSAEALDLINTATENLADRPDLLEILGHLGQHLDDSDKEAIALMLLRIIASDGRQDASEIDALGQVSSAMAISPETMHSAFDRYFDER